MALTRPKIWDIDTNIQYFMDPITTLHQGSTQANVDVGFLFNRANGLVSNVALYWSETGNTFVTAFTANSGQDGSQYGNIAPTGYANLTIGSLLTINGSAIQFAPNAGIILNGSSGLSGYVLTASGTGGLSWAPPGTFSGGTLPNQLVVNSGAASTSTTTGALVVNGGVGVSGNIYVGSSIVSTGTGYMQIPAGTNAQRPSVGSLGMIRYNSDISSYEGFGAGSAWSSLGGVKSVDGKAYISAEASAGAGDDVIRVYSGSTGTSTQVMWASGSNVSVLPTTVATSTTTGALQVAGGVGIQGALYAGSIQATPIGSSTASSGTFTTGLFTSANSTVANITGTTTSSSTTTGALVVAGGLGVAGATYSGSVYDAGNRVVTTLTSSGDGALTIGGTAPTLSVSLPTAGPGATTVGSSVSIPVITIDAYGRVVGLTSSTVSTTINLAGTSGTGSVSGGGTLTFTSTNGMLVAASGSTISVSTPQNLQTTGTPTFAGLTTNGATQINSTLGVTGVTTITNSTVSSGTGTGALVITGGIGAGATSYFGGDLYVTGNIFTPNLVATSTSTLNTSSPMAYFQVTPSYPYNYETGFYSHFVGGPANVYAHTGFVRNHNNNYWTFFSNVRTEPTSTTINFADTGIIYDTIYAGGAIFANATPSTSISSGAIVVTGGAGIGGNLNVNSAAYIGYNAASTPLINPSIIATQSSQAVNAGQFYVQSALINNSGTGSADIVAYPNNTTDGSTGFMDMGFTGNLFADPAYTITKANDGYLFASARNGSALGGNLILATDSTGTYNDIVIATGSFYANAEVARFHGNASTSGYLQITTGTAASSTTTGALRITGGAGVSGAVYAGSVYDSGNRVVSTSSGAGNLTISGAAISLPTMGPGVTTVGSSTAIPVITTDAYGRITALTSQAVSTTINLAGTSGTGSVAGGGTLTFAGSNGFGATVSGSTITLTNPQNLQTNASPTFAGATITGAVTLTANISVAANITRNNRNVVTNFTGNTAPTTPLQGDEWFAANTGSLYKYVYDNVSNTYNWVNFSSALYNATTTATANTLALRDAGANLTATNFIGVASQAKYADLAEIYAADNSYEPATVVVFGGTSEITTTKKTHDTRVAGVISTDPAYLMNSEATGLPVAFTGRVPCKVRGPVEKGDVLVTSAYEGYAERMTDALYRPGCILGKALGTVADKEFATIEVVVGRF